MPELCKPIDLGITGYPEWRRGQENAVIESCQSPERFIAQVAGTGFGKSLANVSAGVISGNAVYLTSTKALQDQLLRDFSSMGLTDIRGRSNYQCTGKTYADGSSMDCDTGGDYRCMAHSIGGCPYANQVLLAKSAPLASTNYAYHVVTVNDPIKRPDLVILDEAHAAHDELVGLLSVRLKDAEIFGITRQRIPGFKSATEIGIWASGVVGVVEGLIERLKANGNKSREQAGELRRLKELAGKLGLLTLCQDDLWVYEEKDGELLCDPVWGADYTEKYLFQGARKVLLTSASMGAKTLELLGITQDYRLTHYTWDFPANNQPVYVANIVLADHRMDAVDEALWFQAIETIMHKRGDRKGIVHTVSYTRAEQMVRRLGKEFPNRVLTHKPGELPRVLEQFRTSHLPLVLFSPVVTTGYDFPGAECEFQIIPKVPYPDRRSKVMDTRCKADSEYQYYLIAQTITQACGRGRRYKDDRCETFIIDGHFGHIYRKHRQFFPPWFHSLVRSVRDGMKGLERIEPLGKL